MWLVGKNNTKVSMPSGAYEVRQSGDPCPEAESWKSPKRWEKFGHIRWVEDQIVTPDMKKAYDDAKKRGAKGKGKTASGSETAAEHTEASLSKMKLAELEKLAESLSAEPETDEGKAPTKADFAAAILKAQAEAEAKAA